ncbi:MAG: hypothetical protein J4F39_14345, partial [Candidatus Latescibacteria bacterium]|nr:hypothetical protein [Candidatus Latescibacterota bacterium]
LLTLAKSPNQLHDVAGNPRPKFTVSWNSDDEIRVQAVLIHRMLTPLSELESISNKNCLDILRPETGR